MIRLCGAALGFFAFSVTIFLGMVAGNPTDVTIYRAVGAMFLFCAIGMGTGWVARQVLDEHTTAKKREMFKDDEADESAVESDQAVAKPTAE